MSTVTQWQFILALLIAFSCCVVESKVFKRCELAKMLRQHHRLDLTEVAQWVCIAQHSSGFNTAAQAHSPSGGSHGLFQISDVYWCSPPGQGSGCNLPCHKLRDDNLDDDLSCVKRIFDEHHRISGDGYTAWNAYQQFCKNNAASYIQDCFSGERTGLTYTAPAKSYNSYHGQFSGNAIQDYSPKKSAKVYERCELARELHHKHKMPMQQIPTWVCIAEHESRFNTAAVGRLNSDGSADHGLFQISDLYWCSHDRFSGGKACGLSCNKLLDNDITDDVRCVKRIHNEHTAISGDGFAAWTVYKPHCQNQSYEHIANCFKNTQQTTHHKVKSTAVGLTTNQVHTTSKFDLNSSNPFFKNVVQKTSTKAHYTPPTYNDVFKTPTSTSSSNNRGVSHTGKFYTRCSLAQELFSKHNFPMQDIPTWVCIAEHESQFNTAAVGHSNTDGSADHGLFQISDRYWCDHNAYGGKACNLPCDKLLDDDLRDDVACIKIIHNEHTRISGDGFNAWTVYMPHCQNQNIEHVKSCFDAKTLQSVEVVQASPNYNVPVVTGKGKIYSKCELAQELYHKHRMPMEQIPKWVCIAQHESSFNTGAVGRLNTDGSADHGLFQISDLYWCTHDQYGGKACNIPCHKLLDSDITDDVKCIRIIHEEHTRISGDGFNAWTVYQPHCRNTGMDHVKKCFTDQELKQVVNKTPPFNTNSLVPQSSVGTKSVSKGKIYKKCELAHELYHKHRMPMEQIPKWVCIAQHESSYNTAAVGRLNTDGSADHGLFQISDLYWCTHDQFGGKACNIPCDKLLDSDITDDVRCIQIIHEEHNRISGDGFNAWTVYKPHCRNTGMSHIKECFTEKELKQANVVTNSIKPIHTPPTIHTPKGKIYKKCELAQELLSKHKMPMEQIPTWVCIAQHESSFNTAAVGRLNADGSFDHGLFQISDLYWCSHDKYGGKACNIPCDKLLDSDITDDVRCIKIIHEEHTRISGDGFNAWTVYKPHCRNRKIEEIRSCFSPNQIEQHIYSNKPTFQTPSYTNNHFLSGGFETQASNQNVIFTSYNEKPNYANNPFLQNIKIPSGSNQINKLFDGFQKPSTAVEIDQSLAVTSKPNYKDNPFLNGGFSSLSGNNLISKPVEIISELDSFKTNPFLSSSLKLSTTVKPTKSSLLNNVFIQTTSGYKSEVTKNYLNSNHFRTTTTLKPTTTATKPTTTSWTTTRKPVTKSTASAKPISKTTQKPTTLKPITTAIKSTTSSWITTRKPTTKSTAADTTTQKSKTIKPTSKKPATTTTTKRPTTTSKNPTAITRTTKSPKTTTNWSWQNQKSTTTRPKTTTTDSRQQQKYPSSSTTKSPRTTTTWNWKNQKYIINATLGQFTTTKSPRTTTTKSERATWNWRNEQKSTTVKPLTTKANWRKWDKPTTKATTKKPGTTTTTSSKSTNNWWSTTTKPTAARTTKPIRLDNHKTTTLKSHQFEASRTTTAKTTRATTAKPIRLDNYKTTTSKPQINRPYYNDNHKTTTHRPQTTTTRLVQQKTTITTTTRKPFTTISSTNTDYSKYKNDPFSHPFFAKVNEQFKQLPGNRTTTKLPIFTATKLQSFRHSSLYEEFKNNTFNKTKTIVSYNFDGSKLTTTKRPRS